MIFNREQEMKKQYRKDNRLSPAAKVFLQYVMDQADDTLSVEDSNTWAAEMLGCTPATISKWVKKLVKYGYITIEYWMDFEHRPRRRIHLDPHFVFGPDWQPKTERKKVTAADYWDQLKCSN